MYFFFTILLEYLAFGFLLSFYFLILLTKDCRMLQSVVILIRL